MTGNAVEEGLLTQGSNPSHSDIARMSVPAGGAAGIFIWFLLLGAFPGLGAGVAALLSFGLAVWTATRVHRSLAARRAGRLSASMQAARDAAEAETRRRIAMMARDADK